MEQKPITQDKIPTLMREGWILKQGNLSGHWWLENPAFDIFYKKVYRASAQALERRGVIKRTARDFHRGDTFVLVQ